MLTIHNPIFWRSALCCFFGELGDKTFFVTVLLAAWCPSWDGVRNSADGKTMACILQLLVLAGAALSLLVRTLLVSAGVHPAWWVAGFNFIACATFIGFGVFVRFQQVSAGKVDKLTGAGSKNADNPFLTSRSYYPTELEASNTDNDESARWNTWAQQKMTSGETWNPLSYKPAYSAGVNSSEPAGAQSLASGWQRQSYGTVRALPKDVGGQSGNEVIFMIAAFLAGLVTVFMCESLDKSQMAFVNGGNHKYDFGGVISAMFGYIPALVVAVGVGCILEGTLMDEWLLFTIQIGFFSLGFISFSQACFAMASMSPTGTNMVLLLTSQWSQRVR